MMPTKQLNSNVVPSIADTDLVTIPSPQGALQNITFENFMTAVRERIQIGGRNLLKNSFQSKTLNGYAGTSYALSENLKEGELYTISFDVEIVSIVVNIYVYLTQSSSSTLRQYIFSNVNPINSSKRHYLTFKANSNAVASNVLTFYNEVNGYAQKGSAVISQVKLERGNIATDWTPAPEDIASGTWGG